MKKAFVLGMGILFSIGLFTTACTSDDTGDDVKIPFGLAEYKEDAKAKLAAYVETLEPNDYSGENWAAIEAIANRGKENIDTASDKQGVDSMLAAAKDEIGQTGQREKTEEEHLEIPDSLAEYKEDAKAKLAAYVETLEPNDYSGENWAAIEAIANKGKKNIDTASDKQGVNSVLTAAKDAIGQIGQRDKTEEEHLEIIREKLHRRYFNDDGTPTYYASFQDLQYIDNKWTAVTVTLESFDVEILLSFDGIPEHFLVTYKPFAIGYVPGLIIGNEYYIFALNRIPNSNNPFEENGIEKGKRYYMFPGSPSNGFAAIIDGAFTDLLDGHIYSENEIKNRLEFLRSEQGLNFMKNPFYSSHL
ncbi:MAG: hypothetical protein FWH41_08755 [Treponema sp.]|nr:hypothetical protein [Treponema sp.]